jgi:hypothetical protein
MRIQPSKKTKSYLSSKDQRRLLGLVGILALILVASRMAANPNNWAWMFRGQNQAKKTGTPEKTAKSGKGQLTVVSKSSKLASSAKSNKPRKTLDKQTIEIEQSFFDKVEDKSWDIPGKESRAYYQVLAHVARLSQDVLQREAKTNASLTVLMNAPEVHRGSVLTITGKLRKIRRIPDAIPSKDLKPASTKKDDTEKQPGTPLYDAWIHTTDSDTTLYRVVFSELPKEAGTIEKEKEFDPPLPVRVTGYFFKVQKYAISETTSNLAPLLLAKRLRILKNPTDSARSLSAAPYIVGFVICILLALSVAIWRFSKGDQAFQKDHIQRLSEPSSSEKIALNNITADSPENLFAHLEGRDSEGSSSDEKE